MTSGGLNDQVATLFLFPCFLKFKFAVSLAQ